MKLLAENNDYKLYYDPQAVNRYCVYHRTSPSPSGELKLDVMVAQSPNFTPKLKGYFTNLQVQTAIAKVHAMKYVNRKFKI